MLQALKSVLEPIPEFEGNERGAAPMLEVSITYRNLLTKESSSTGAEGTTGSTFINIRSANILGSLSQIFDSKP